MDELESLAHRLDVRIERWQGLRHGRWGDYCHRRHRIRLVWDLDPVQYRSTLAHELGHAAFTHRRTNSFTELEADVYAARILIAPTCWHNATSSYGDVFTVADELSVLPRLVVVYAKHLARHPAIRHP